MNKIQKLINKADKLQILLDKADKNKPYSIFNSILEEAFNEHLKPRIDEHINTLFANCRYWNGHQHLPYENFDHIRMAFSFPLRTDHIPVDDKVLNYLTTLRNFISDEDFLFQSPHCAWTYAPNSVIGPALFQEGCDLFDDYPGGPYIMVACYRINSFKLDSGQVIPAHEHDRYYNMKVFL